MVGMALGTSVSLRRMSGHPTYNWRCFFVVVVVDFTGKNPNVMYETGIAHTLGKLVVPISQSLEDVPFDMAHHRCLNYLSNAEGFSNLSKKLAAKLKQTSD